MLSDDEIAALAAVFADQAGDDARVGPVVPQRMAVIARNPAAMSRAEMAALLVSARFRAAFDAARLAPPAPANDNRYELVARSFAADDGRADRIELEAAFGTLLVRPGPDAEVPHLLTFRLDPNVPGGLAERRVMVWETRSGRVWLDGRTDDTGVLHAAWPFGAARPRDRVRDDTLFFALSEAAAP